MNKRLILTLAGVVACLAVCIALAIFLVVPNFGNYVMGTAEPADAFLGLRNLALTATAKQLALPLDDKSSEPYGVLMEMRVNSGSFTLTSFATGDASLYFSSGGGIIGGIGHEKVNMAANKFVAKSASFTSRMRIVESFPLPTKGVANFFILTPSGVYAAQVDENALTSGKSEFSPLFLSAEDVITELRIVAQSQPNSPYK